MKNSEVLAFDPSANAVREIPSELVARMQERFGERCSLAMAVREHHGHDESAYTNIRLPDMVLFAESREDVVDLMKLASEYAVPVIAFGAGSSLEGHLLAVHGGISVDMSRMNKIIEIHADDLTVTVQPGVTRKQLNEAIRHSGLFFPVDPGADATIGGMSATRASGTTAVRYGTMRDNVMALEVVTADGEIVRTGTRARKSSAGYDVTRLFVGSEGTLGIFTEITLRIHPLPEAVSAAICSFPTIEGAIRTTIQTIQFGVPIARVELIDSNSVRMVNAYSKLNLPENHMLLMEFHGTEASVKEQAENVQMIASEYGGQGFEWSHTPEERTRLWAARHHAYFAAIQSRPGCRAISTDTCVPISALAECLLDSIAEVDHSGIPYFLVGHVGDGNFHFGYLIDPHNPEERETAEQLNRQLVHRALRLGGTCTGEHGIGLHKMDFLVREAGPGSINIMRKIKQALDPQNILNPGKIFSE